MSSPNHEIAEAMTRYLLEATRAALGPVDAALEMASDEDLARQPVPEQMPLGKMIEHVYGAVAFTSRSIRRGKCEESDVADLMWEGDTTGTRPRILEIRELALAESEAALSELDRAKAGREIEFFFGWKMDGLGTAGLGYEELCHHRGQIQSFLRLLGHEPPPIHAPVEEAGAATGD